MKKLLLALSMSILGVAYTLPANAMPVITLEPTPDFAVPPENVFVDIVISGLQSDGLDAVVGAWELDFFFDSSYFQFLAVPPAGVSGALGDIDAGEAISLAEAPIDGVFHVGALSLLEESLDSCFFCFGPYLDELQGDSVVLATIGLFAPGGAASAPVSPLIGVGNAIVSDGGGNQLAVTIPVSPAWMLILGGLLYWRIADRRRV